MSLNIASLSNVAKAELLARIAHRLTVCARDTYEVGTDDVLDPKALRAFNELLHRITATVSEHLMGTDGFSLETIFQMMDDFGERYNRRGLITWAKEPLVSYTPEYPYKVN